MPRPALRLLSLTLALLLAPIVLGPVQAQPLSQASSNDLKPRLAVLDDGAFTSQRNGATSGARVLETDARRAVLFTDLMIRWQADEPLGSSLLLEVRTSNDGTNWTKWGQVSVSDAPLDFDEPENTRWSDAIYADQSQFYQIRATFTPTPGGKMPTLISLDINTVDARMPNGVTPRPDSGGERTATGIGRPAFVSRTGWGNPQGEYAPDAPPAYYTANHLIVHHTADANTLVGSERSWADRVRAEWSFHTYSRGWGDIGYNWLIDPNGVIYAGRAGSTDLTRDAVGFHDTANYGSMGVSMLGTYTTVSPTQKTQDSLVQLLAWKASQRNIDPLGSSYYYGCDRSTYCKPKLGTAVVPNIAGHRQVTPGHTTCPGDKGMEALQSVRQRVYQVLYGAPDNGDQTVEENESTFTKAPATMDAWHAKACGSGGSTLWTYATNGSEGVSSSNSGVWRPNLPRSGQYKVLVHVPQGCAISSSPPYATTNARYSIQHADGTSTASVDHNTEQSWVELGTFTFNAGTSGYVRLTDQTSEPFSAQKVIFFDAVQWVYVTPPPPQASARLISARVLDTDVIVGETVPIEFTVQNGPITISTQAPDAGSPSNPADGWVYDEGECFLGNTAGSYPAYPKESGRLRVMLGLSSGSLAAGCVGDTGGFPWRWGLGSALQPNETRTIRGYVRFRTPGTYSLKANLINEYIRTYGTDGNGMDAGIGSVTVRPENRAPEIGTFDASFASEASVYQLVPAPDSLLARTANPLSIIEGQRIGGFQWDGSGRAWGAGGPLGQSDRFVIRQSRTFYAPSSGTYQFRLTSDDGSWLWIDGAQVVVNEGLHPIEARQGQVYLSAGLHTIAVKFFENAGEAYSSYSWLPPGAASFAPIPVIRNTEHVGPLFRGGQQMVLSADDLGGSGLRALRYVIDGGAEQSSTVGRVPITLGAGSHTITYYAEDNNGSRSPTMRSTLTVDPALQIRTSYLPFTPR